MTNGSTNKSANGLSGQHFALLLFIIVGGYFLWAEHKAHIMGALPYLILLLCPMIHFFMHRGHGHHDKDMENHDHPGKGGMS